MRGSRAGCVLGFGRDSNKAAKELGDFGNTLFNAGEAARAMAVCKFVC